MNFSLTEDQQAFADLAAQFSAKSLAPNAAEWDATGYFPKEVFKAAGELGFMGLYTNPDLADWACRALMRQLSLKNWRMAIRQLPHS